MSNLLLLSSLIFFINIVACSPVAGIPPNYGGGGNGSGGGGDPNGGGNPNPSTLQYPKLYAFPKNNSADLCQSRGEKILKRLTNRKVGRIKASYMKGTGRQEIQDFSLELNQRSKFIESLQKTIKSYDIKKNTVNLFGEGRQITSYTNSPIRIVYNGGINQTNVRYNIAVYKNEPLNATVAFGIVNRRPLEGFSAEGYALIEIDEPAEDSYIHVRSLVTKEGNVIPDEITNIDVDPEFAIQAWKERIDWLDGVEVRGAGESLLTLARSFTNNGITYDYGNYMKLFDPTSSTNPLPTLITYDTGRIFLPQVQDPNTQFTAIDFVELIDSNHAIYKTKESINGEQGYLIIEIAGGDLVAHVKQYNSNTSSDTWLWTKDDYDNDRIKKQAIDSPNRGSIVSGYTTIN